MLPNISTQALEHQIAKVMIIGNDIDNSNDEIHINADIMMMLLIIMVII